jgi:hypothetical protein
MYMKCSHPGHSVQGTQAVRPPEFSDQADSSSAAERFPSKDDSQTYPKAQISQRQVDSVSPSTDKKDPQDISFNPTQRGPFSKRPHPGTDTSPVTTTPVERSQPPPLEPGEYEPLSKELPGASGSSGETSLMRVPFLRKIVASAFLIAFGLVAFYIFLELILVINVIFGWPLVARLPLLILIGTLLAYTGYKACLLLLSFRRLRRVKLSSLKDIESRDTRDRDKLRDSLFTHLHDIKNSPQDRSPELLKCVESLIENRSAVGSGAWLKNYRDNIQPKLREAAYTATKSIAFTAGFAAAICPWRLFDAVISLNASLESAAKVLRIFGIRPDAETVACFAFDTLLATVFALSEEMIEGTVDTLAEGMHQSVGEVLGQTLVSQVGPKAAQGVAVGFFIRRISNRMVKRLAPI